MSVSKISMPRSALARAPGAQQRSAAVTKISALRGSPASANSVVREDVGESCRKMLAAAVIALSVSASPATALAAAEAPSAAAPSGNGAAVSTVYFGNGCYWARQKDFVEVERGQLGRSKPADISAVVGYAGGQRTGPDGKVCYYYGDPRAVYERLGHAEVVQLALSAEDPNKAEAEFKAFAQRYFKQFVRTPAGMMRSDPQDAGPGYRNVIGLPGGTSSPFFKLLEDANVNKMELRPGKGNPGEGPEEDLVNVVWVVDSNQLPFYRAEKWHQFHNGVGRKYPDEYTRDLKKAVEATGKIESTGCPEFPWL